MFCINCNNWRAPDPRPVGNNPMADSLEGIAEIARERMNDETGHIHAWDMVRELAGQALQTLPASYGECWGMDLVSDTNQAPKQGDPYILIESRHDQPVLRTVATFTCANWKPKAAAPVAMPATELSDEIGLQLAA